MYFCTPGAEVIDFGGAVARLRQWWLGRDLAADVFAVQTIVIRSCDYLPSVAGVAALLGSTAGLTAAGVALLICDEMKRVQRRVGLLRAHKQQIVVNGVYVEMVKV